MSAMKISCVRSVNEAIAYPAELILFPEGTAEAQLLECSALFPTSLVIGAFAEKSHCRGVVIRESQAVVSYLKVHGDGRTKGSDNHLQQPFRKFGDELAVGLLVCKDIDDPDFSTVVLDWLKSRRCRYRVLCIPADMGAEWLAGPTLPWPPRYHGIHVALCNSTRTYQEIRCQSFVTDLSGRKFVIQQKREPIRASLD